MRRIMKKEDLKFFLVTVFKGKMISHIKPVTGQNHIDRYSITNHTRERLRADH